MALHPWLDVDLEKAAESIPQKMREIVSSTLLRRGCVVAVSGIDSSVCAALATLAMGKGKVFALVLPERDSSPRSKELGVQLCEHLGIPYEVKDIASTLEAIGRSPISTKAKSTSSQTTSDCPKPSAPQNQPRTPTASSRDKTSFTSSSPTTGWTYFMRPERGENGR